VPDRGLALGRADGGRADRGRADGGREHRGRVDGGREHRGHADGGHADGGRADGGRADRRPADNGNAALELLILAPVILFLIGLVIAYGRTSIAQGAVDAAAREAARQASLASSPAAARQAATSSARSALLSDGLQCQATVRLNLGQAFATPLGQPAAVSATVSCTVSLANLLVPGIPGSRKLSASFTSPLDPYRSRALGALSRSVTAASQERGQAASQAPR